MLWVVLLIAHGLLAFLLLGALTHQTVNVIWPRQPKGAFVQRFAAVSGIAYANAIVILFIVTFMFGAWIYADYRVEVKPPLEDMRAWVPVGLFELKEHFIAFALAVLPVYWVLWKKIPLNQHNGLRASLTVVIAFCSWWSFLVGHILNNARGLGGA
jgi:hypothetical protein